MISAEVIKGVQELLEERGLRQKQDERLGDFVARGLGITAAQADALLSALHDGADVDEAVRIAGIQPGALDRDLLTRIARSIGTALGRAASRQ